MGKRETRVTMRNRTTEPRTIVRFLNGDDEPQTYSDAIDDALTLGDMIDRGTLGARIEERLAADSRTARTMRDGSRCSMFDDDPDGG